MACSYTIPSLEGSIPSSEAASESYLIPKCNLSMVPSRTSRRDKHLHVPQVDDFAGLVVLAVALLRPKA